MTNPMISVIVPVYDVSTYLEDFFLCMRRQIFRNYEIIVWDDGSTDDSVTICNQIAQADARIRVFHGSNMGVAIARKSAIGKARGEYIVFADPDDILDPAYLQAMFDIVQAGSLDFVASQCYEETDPKISRDFSMNGPDASLRISGLECAEKILNRDFDASDYPIRAELWGKIYRRTLFDGIEYPVQRTCSDVMLLSGVICKVQHAAVISNKLYHYRISRDNSLQTKVSTDKLHDIWNSHLYVDTCFRKTFDIDEYYYLADEYCTLFHIFTNIMNWSYVENTMKLKEAFLFYQHKLKGLPLPAHCPKVIRLKKMIYASGYGWARLVFYVYSRLKRDLR